MAPNQPTPSREPTGGRIGALATAAIALALTLAACAPGSGAAAGGETPGPRSPVISPRPSPLVDPRDIVPGGPPPDGIPPIDHPKFLTVAEVHFLTPAEPVLSVEIHGQAKAYPLRIMVWHEIVNDSIGGTPVTVTYCPLCNTGIAYVRPVIDGKLLDFGTSGKLYNSNLVMYDRQTNSYWPQALGEAVTGPLTGTKLRFVATQLLSWRDWKVAYPDGLVLSQRTGFSREYGTNPYGGYDEEAYPGLFIGHADRRLPLLTYVLGVDVDDNFVAFPFPELQRRAEGGHAAVNEQVGGRSIVVLWQTGTVSAVNASSIPDSKDIGAAMAFERRLGGRSLTFEATSSGIVDRQTGSRWDITGRAVAGPLTGERLQPVLATNSFWFDWAAFHPDTSIYGR